MECKIPATYLGENLTEHGLPAGICVHIKPEEAVDCSQQHIESVVVKEEPKHEAEEPLPEPISQENVVILTSGYEITIKDELPDEQPLDIVVQEEPVPEEPASSALRCDKCNKQFTIARSYRVHCQRHRDIESERYLCKPCRRPFGTLHDLTRHERKVHGAIGDNPEATFQESEAIATSGFEVTVKEEPSDDPGATDEKPLTIAVKEEPAPEEEEESKPQQRAALRCGRCKKHFNSAGSYKMHCQRHRNIERRRFVCKPCRKPFGALRDLTRHERHTHGVVQGQVQQRVYRCKFKFCEKTFDSVETFQEHVQAHRNVQKRLFACEKCGKCFVNRSSLKRHVQLNVCETMPRALEEDGGIFKCSTCGKTFSQRYLIDQHIRRHLARTDFREKTLDLTEKHTAQAGSEPIEVQRNGEECFKCPLCSKLFRQRYPCVRHIRRHIERARGTFQCETCGLYLGNNKELIQHEVDKHGKIKPEPEEPLQVDEKGQFKCTECTKTFTQRRLVLRHLRRHKALSEGAFQCKICGKFFAANAELLHHSIEKHNEAQKVPKVDPLEKDADGRFKCTQCEQTFALRAQCSAHIRRHKIKDSGQYRCKKCSKCFVRPKDLENHERAATSLTKSLCSKNRESLKINAEKNCKDK
uniref:Putative c2h2-type zn-finger protein n=1 Tax=Culex tarsalis TaxID=7177 RepID=A0A1Q3F734_CULTA